MRHPWSSAVLVAWLGCDGAAAPSARPAPPPPATANAAAPLLTCRGVPMYPGKGVPDGVELEVRANPTLADATVRLTLAGLAPHALRAAFEVEQRGLRRGFRAELAGTLVDAWSGAAVGKLSFSVTVRDDQGAMPGEDELLRGLALLFVTTAPGDSTPYGLTCTAPSPVVGGGD